MGFYHTSSNFRLIRSILLDYDSTPNTSPYEYMKQYVDKCPDDFFDAKITWIAETFLSLQKHIEFFREIALHLSEQLAPEEQDYFMIALQAIIFQLDPKDLKNIYKALFNLSKDLLNIFTEFLSNNEVLTYIAAVAQNYYDATYITDNIIEPLFKWQPYISEMAHDYAEYVQKVEDKKTKPLTVPVSPTVLKRKGKEVPKAPSTPTLQISQTKIHNKNRKMLTKTAIDTKLKELHEQNKQNATALLKSSKSHAQNYHVKKKKTRVSDDNQSNEIPLPKPKKIVSKSTLPPVRENVAVIKRMSNIVKKTEEEEIKWLEQMLSCCGNYKRVDELMEADRIENEKERLYEIEKKHLEGQISHEQAALAKKNALDQNKKKAEELWKEKQAWENTIEKIRIQQLNKCRQNILECSMTELRIQEVRNAISEKNKEEAKKLKELQRAMQDQKLKQQQEELNAKIDMIKQIKVLALVAKRTKVPKIVDLTETAGLGLMCEMSIAELQERLASLKIGIKEEIERKRITLKENKERVKKELEEQMNNVKEFFDEREDMRKQAKLAKKIPVVLSNESKTKLDDLKKLLEAKRQERRKLVDRADAQAFKVLK